MDDLTIRGIARVPVPDAAAATDRGSSASGPGFLTSLKEAIEKVNTIQLEANRAAEQLMTGQTQDVHQTMVALQKAEVSFQLMMQVRNKLVAAYEEIQRMQI